MRLRSAELLDIVLDEFPVDTSSTTRVQVQDLRRDTRIYKVDPRKSPLIPMDANVGEPYIIDTPSGRKIACHPHIVGEELGETCLDCAREFFKAIVDMGLQGEATLRSSIS